VVEKNVVVALIQNDGPFSNFRRAAFGRMMAEGRTINHDSPDAKAGRETEEKA